MNKRSNKTNSTWFVDCHFTSVCKINAMPTRQRGQHVMTFLTWGNVDDLFDDGILGLLVLFPALGVLLIDGAQFTADMWKCTWMRTDNQLTERGHGSPAADVRCVTQTCLWNALRSSEHPTWWISCCSSESSLPCRWPSGKNPAWHLTPVSPSYQHPDLEHVQHYNELKLKQQLKNKYWSTPSSHPFSDLYLGHCSRRQIYRYMFEKVLPCGCHMRRLHGTRIPGTIS